MYASDYRRIARGSLTGNFWPSVLAAFIAAFFGAQVTSGNLGFKFEIDWDTLNDFWNEHHRISLFTIGSLSSLSLVTFILGGVIQLGYAQYLLKQYDHKERNIKDLFSQFDRFGQGFLQLFLRGLFTMLWSLLFIIPGIVKALSYSMAPFIMADHPELSATEAIEESKALMYGHKWELFFLNFSFIGWNLLCLLTLGLGFLLLNPYINAAYTAFYRHITCQP